MRINGYVGTTMAAFAGALLYGPLAWAQPTNAELSDLVRQQAAQIERLEQRLDAVEGAQDFQSKPRSRQAARKMQATSESPGTESAAVPLQRQIDRLQEKSVQVDWSSGAPEFSSNDGEFTFRPFGRIQFDTSTTQGGGGGRDDTGTEFRRLRLAVDGQLTKPILYRIQLDFADNDVKIRDVFLATKKDFALGQGIVYLGNKRADRGINGGTSSKYTWFVDRNAVTHAITPQAGSYFTGVTGAFYGNNDWHFSLGVNKGDIGNAEGDSGNLSVLSRAHFNPIATDEFVLHLGAFGFYDSFHGDDSFENSFRIATHSNDKVRVGSRIDGEPDQGAGYGLELAGVAGPLAASAEYGQRTIEITGQPDADIAAYTGQIGYSLTGEPFGYSTRKGVWTHPDIAHPVTRGGLGAWQLVARYQALDYDNGSGYDGDTGHGATVGLSWYLNDTLRMLLDYTSWQTTNRTAAFVPDGGDLGRHDGNTVAARAQLVF